jgi:hypothetical protein
VRNVFSIAMDSGGSTLERPLIYSMRLSNRAVGVKLLASRFELSELFRRLRKRKPPTEEDPTETAAYGSHHYAFRKSVARSF